MLFIMLGLVIVVGFTSFQILVAGRSRFDPIVWEAAQGQGGPERRCEMVNDLMHQYLHVGMPYSDVRSLLGPPDSHGRSAAGDPTALVYDLGSCGAIFALDENYLVITYDRQGLVTNVRTSEYWWPVP
jgi:hypothetical protein